MIEVVLAVLLAVASGLGALFWRKSPTARAEAREVIDDARHEAERRNEGREATIVANVEAIEERVAAIDDDREGRQKLADLLNR